MERSGKGLQRTHRFRVSRRPASGIEVKMEKAAAGNSCGGLLASEASPGPRPEFQSSCFHEARAHAESQCLLIGAGL